MKEHIVRDMRQQMVRRGLEEAYSSDTPERERERAAGGEALCPLNNYQNIIKRSNNVLPN